MNFNSKRPTFLSLKPSYPQEHDETLSLGNPVACVSTDCLGNPKDWEADLPEKNPLPGDVYSRSAAKSLQGLPAQMIMYNVQGQGMSVQTSSFVHRHRPSA